MIVRKRMTRVEHYLFMQELKAARKRALELKVAGASDHYIEMQIRQDLKSSEGGIRAAIVKRYESHWLNRLIGYFKKKMGR